jgi:hypothetical protein
VASDAPKRIGSELKQWKLVSDFRARLEPALKIQAPHPSWQHPNRQFDQADYLSLFMMGLVNPVIKTARALSVVSEIERVQEEVGCPYISLSSFSEAQHVVQPEVLEEVLASLRAEIHEPMPKDPRQAWQVWMARDSSIFSATWRMFWAQYGAGKAGEPNHGVRFHVSFCLDDDSPAEVAVTPGKTCERKVWREQLVPGAAYVGDRYFGEDYKMFARLEEKNCRFVLRLRDEAVWNVEQANALTPEELKAGIVSDEWGHLGSVKRYRTQRLRVITVRKPSGTMMRLVTNMAPEQLSALEILTIYRRRWQIECYFRWLKCLLGCRHWLAESQNGVTIQLYLATIAGLMLHLLLGRRPNRRLWERVQLFLMGWATGDELMSAVEKARQKATAKKS